jgi:hypothetical protein
MFEAGRLDESDQIRRYRDSHLVATGQQLTGHRGARLDVPSGAVNGNREFHCRQFRRLVRKVFVFRRLSGFVRRTPD